MATTKFSFHDKRVTLNLARLSTAADQDQAFAAVLNQLPGLGWDVYKLNQEEQELLFAEFDAELEERIKGEFIADPSYVIDLGHAMGICPLCGHVGCRYIFRITNTVNGKTIECGSECIITHGLCVKGAETAEHARKALECTIRRHIRKLKIEAWHKDMGFDAALFDTLQEGLVHVAGEPTLPYRIRKSAYFKYQKDLPKLRRFYERSGWLNTEKRWAEWTRLVSFARKFNPSTRKAMSYPLPHGYKAGEPVKLVKAEPAPSDAEVEAIEAEAEKASTVDTWVENTPEQTAALLEKKAPKAETPKAESLPQPVQSELPFSSIAHDLVFG